MGDRQTRRRYLCMVGTIGVTGLAGCGGADEGASNGDGDPGTDTPEAETEEDQPADEDEQTTVEPDDEAEEPSVTDVPMLGYDPARTSAPPGANGPTDPVVERWQTELDGQLVASPVVADGMVYTGGSDQEVRALIAEEGAESWRLGTDGEVRSTPAVVDGTVYIGSFDGSVYALVAE